MKRNTMLKILNPILGVIFSSQVFTGIFHDSIPHNVFEMMHQGGGYVLAAAVILHVILNWNWVKVNVLKSNPARES